VVHVLEQLGAAPLLGLQLDLGAHQRQRRLQFMRGHGQEFLLVPEAGVQPVQQLLHLAEVCEHQRYRMEEIAPGAIIGEVCDFMARACEKSGVHIHCEVQDGARPWHADRGALFVLLKNLIENAVQHSPQGSTVTVRATDEGFCVADQGRGVPAQDLGRIFERFWRSSERRDLGAGLGLPICLEIARAHGWTLTARPGATGLEIEARFSGPAQAPSSSPARPS
jgi:signal transduction histidine kinase